MENEVENSQRHQTRAHPYKSPNNTTGLKITHNFFSFANNTTSLFPQQQLQQRQPLGILKSVSGPSGSSKLQVPAAPKRQPFQELNSNHHHHNSSCSSSASSFVKIPSSFKLTDSNLTLKSDSSVASQEVTAEEVCHDEEEAKPEDVEMASPQLLPRLHSPGQYPDYCVDILANWNNSQHRSRPRKYMDKQKDISFRMRAILIDWLVEVALEFETLQETLFLSTNIIDRFLSRMSVPKSKLQLIGTASFFIACKYEEVSPPGVKDFVYITDDTYTKEQILRMEQIILQALDFDLLPPTSYTFTKAYCRLLHLSPQETSLAYYLTELTMIDGEKYTTILPSLIATGAVALSRYTYQDIFWDHDLCTLTPHVRSEAQRCAQFLYNTFEEAATWSQTAVYDKYKVAKYYQVSSTLSPKIPWP